MRTYRRVTEEDRFRLKTYLDVGLNQSEAAVKLGLNKSTISRELARNRGGRGYRHKQAQRFSEERQEWRAELHKMDRAMVKTVKRLLSSPPLNRNLCKRAYLTPLQSSRLTAK